MVAKLNDFEDFLSGDAQKHFHTNILSLTPFVVDPSKHTPRDSVIASILKRVVDGGSYQRSTSFCTETNRCRQELSFFCPSDDNSISVFRGEEKAGGELKTPLQDLKDKLEWKYGAAPPQLDIKFVWFKLNMMKTKEKFIIWTLLLADSNYFLPCSMATLFHFSADLAVSNIAIICKDGLTTEIGVDSVKKIYEASIFDANINNLDLVLQTMKKLAIRHVEEITKVHIAKKYVVFKLSSVLFSTKVNHGPSTCSALCPYRTA
ncbi:hypothetical protein THRCLA_22123 [Thraustotheca clavata]|uniref:Crinkler (CRN) family protein n=1 Tax=Thraustotheca clavata TaxID=74557 RepID=A0A1V9ZC75_9STRA|nr:hypothetical protein THRCLA_22123 [Thraustotheca clavata]